MAHSETFLASAVNSIFHNNMVITKKEFEYIIRNRGEREFFVNVDFGLRQVRVKVEDDKAVLDGRFHLDLKQKLKDKFCYLVKPRKILPLAFFSTKTNIFYKLIPTEDWPSLALGSVPMHRIIESSPYKDTLRKIQLLKPYGVVLDTCMGLGYTAILASIRSQRVITFEVDRNVLLMAKLNPCSQRLFSQRNIEMKTADVAIYIKRLSKEHFDCVIHDPPTFKLAPQLYSIDFYRQLYRVLKKGGRLYHYLPLYGIRRGYDFPSKIKTKLKGVNFRIQKFSPLRGGLICTK